MAESLHFHLLEETSEVYLTPPDSNTIIWSTNIPLKSNWGKYQSMTISTNKKDTLFSFPTVPKYYHNGLLKSALQKSIRRNKSVAAVSIAYQLLCQERAQLLRRLPVILMEDACLHTDFPFLVWCMIAYSKGWELTSKQVLKILTIVHELSTCSYRDILPTSIQYTDAMNNPIIHGKANVPIFISSSIASLFLRVNYGGMKGDLKMLKILANVWYNRYLSDSKLWDQERKKWYIPCSEIDLEDLKNVMANPPVLKSGDKIKEGIDYHCFRNLVPKTEEKSGISGEDIKRAVWFHRSGINLKQPICTSMDPLTPSYPDVVEGELKGRQETQSVWNSIQHIWESVCTDSLCWKSIDYDDMISNNYRIKNKNISQVNQETPQ